MQPTIHPQTGDPMDGLVELVEHFIALPVHHQTKPLSQVNADKYGHVDPVMWTPVDGDDSGELLLQDNMRTIKSIVSTFKITDQSILDRY